MCLCFFFKTQGKLTQLLWLVGPRAGFGDDFACPWTWPRVGLPPFGGVVGGGFSGLAALSAGAVCLERRRRFLRLFLGVSSAGAGAVLSCFKPKQLKILRMIYRNKMVFLAIKRLGSCQANWLTRSNISTIPRGDTTKGLHRCPVVGICRPAKTI